MFLGVAKIERIDHHADIGRVFTRLAGMRNFDEFERGVMHHRLEFLVAVPVAISFLDDYAALYQQAFEHQVDIEFFYPGVAHTQRHVLEVAEYRQI